MILVLLHKFSESQDSIIGYKLCEKLAEEGFDLLVTSTTKNVEQQAEVKAANCMTETLTGSVRITEVEPEVLETPTPERIYNLQRSHFSRPTDANAIEAIIGALPGTAQCAIELKNMMYCRVILLAQMKISTTKENFKAEVRRLASCADEIWSMGSNVYGHYEEIFREDKKGKRKKMKNITHKEMMVPPEISNTLEIFSKKFRKDRHVLVSVWDSKFHYHISDMKKITKGSSKQAFYAVKSAITRIQKGHKGSEAKILWNIHGLEAKEYTRRDESIPSQVNINILANIPSPDNISWDHCTVYIAPDVHDKSFNFLALVALWFGVPTLVSEDSSIGKFLSSLMTPLKEKPIVRLTGDFKSDRKAWYKKLKEELFSKEANPTQWAKELSEFLKTSQELWQLDLSVLKHSPVLIVCKEDLGSVQYSSRRRKRVRHCGLTKEMPHSKKRKVKKIFQSVCTLH